MIGTNLNIGVKFYESLIGLAHNAWLYGVAGMGALINAAQRNV